MPRKPITPDNAFLRLATLCARSEQAEGDLRRKLHDWALQPSDADAIIDRLKHERYLDNERYARAYCRDKLRFNGWRHPRRRPRRQSQDPERQARRADASRAAALCQLTRLRAKRHLPRPGAPHLHRVTVAII